ncbi:MAG TPA: iron-containing redox enzyme family protein [Nevskiaceae bacterium]|nr:iron-containing redox enzyme family protein [Nevskiaceae bacterium]
MDRFGQLVEATRADHAQHILKNPLIRKLAAGEVTHDLYAVYLGQTYQLVRHTSRALALAAARLPDERRALRAWFLEQAQEEHGHELFCITDLKNLGLDPARVLECGPLPGAWGLYTQNYYMADHGNPAAILGVATATEGMGAELAGGMAQLLVERYGVPATAVTFLRSHAGFDQRHLEQARRAINELALETDLPGILHARRMTFRYYGRLFEDVSESTERYFFRSTLAAA